MKQNKYDTSGFFEDYSKMPRSLHGLAGAGEWPVLRTMLPNFNNKSVLDLGCGFGWHCMYAAEHGAKKVIGTDISEKMITEAIKKSHQKPVYDIIKYEVKAIEDIDFETEEFDIVISSLTFHYIKDLRSVFNKINRYLKKGGSFVFSIEHPIFTANATQDWYRDKNSKALHWPVDNYMNEGIRHTNFLGHDVIKYHRTTETIINTLIKTNFTIKEIAEPKPSKKILEKFPEMENENRRPIFLIISTMKN